MRHAIATIAPFVAFGIALATLGACANEMPQPVPAAPGPPPADAPSEPLPFEIRRDRPALLPFWVRHQRLASLLDVPTTDPVFDTLRANRLLLGDVDHANGVAPDVQWNPAKMALWARSLKPVCAHPNLKARHPFLNIDLPRAAWGRDPTPEEAQGLRDDLDATGLTGAARDEAACLAILSSLEHVTQ